MIIAAVVLGLVLLVALWAIGVYNGLVRLRNLKEEGWSGIDVQLKRRHDLVGNLVNSVKGYMAHEKSTLEELAKARSAAQGASSVTQATQAEGMLSQAMGRLFAVMENYPELKANQNFLELQAQLEGTENRIATERMKFNEAAQAFNTGIRKFPDNIIASMFGFEKKAYFEAQAGAETAPKVEF